MPVPLWPSPEVAWVRILERRWGQALDEAYALELLALSVGVDAALVKHYRGFFVGAKLIEQNLSTQQITEADGAKFTRLQPVIDSLLNSQRQYDESMALVIPAGYEAIPSDCDRCDSKVSVIGGGGGGGIDVIARRPVTIRTKVD